MLATLKKITTHTFFPYSCDKRKTWKFSKRSNQWTWRYWIWAFLIIWTYPCQNWSPSFNLHQLGKKCSVLQKLATIPIVTWDEIFWDSFYHTLTVLISLIEALEGTKLKSLLLFTETIKFWTQHLFLRLSCQWNSYTKYPDLRRKCTCSERGLE